MHEETKVNESVYRNSTTDPHGQIGFTDKCKRMETNNVKGKSYMLVREKTEFYF